MDRNSIEYKDILTELVDDVSCGKFGENMTHARFCIQALSNEDGMLGRESESAYKDYSAAETALCDSDDERQLLSKAVLAGICLGVALQHACPDTAREVVKEMAILGANARHAETRAMKADVFKWLDVNMPTFKSMDAAAAAITKQQPIAFRTAQKWVGDWKKNVR